MTLKEALLAIADGDQNIAYIMKNRKIGLTPIQCHTLDVQDIMLCRVRPSLITAKCVVI